MIVYGTRARLLSQLRGKTDGDFVEISAFRRETYRVIHTATVVFRYWLSGMIILYTAPGRLAKKRNIRFVDGPRATGPTLPYEKASASTFDSRFSDEIAYFAPFTTFVPYAFREYTGPGTYLLNLALVFRHDRNENIVYGFCNGTIVRFYNGTDVSERVTVVSFNVIRRLFRNENRS